MIQSNPSNNINNAKLANNRINAGPNDLNNEEMTVDELQIYVNKLNFIDEAGAYSARHEALMFFADYLQDNVLPPAIFIQFHNILLFKIIPNENPAETNQVIISIISEIAAYINEEINFADIIQYIWRMLPSEESFDALAVLASEQLGAANVLISQVPLIISYINNPDCITNALNLISGITVHKVLLIELIKYLDDFLDFGTKTSGLNLQILYSILNHFAVCQEGLDKICHFQFLDMIFERAFESEETFAAAVKLLTNIASQTSNPYRLFDKANVLSLINKALVSYDEKVLKAVLNLCLSISTDPEGIVNMAQSNTIDLIINLLNSSFSISSIAINVLCNLISEGPIEVVNKFIEPNFLDLLLTLILTVPQNLKVTILTSLQTIVIALETTGRSEDLLNIINSTELMDVLWQLNSDEQYGKSSINLIASFLHEKLVAFSS